MLLEQYKVATLDYSYIVPNFPQGCGRLATSFPRSPLLLVYEMILETRVRVNISTLRGKYWPNYKSGQRLIKNWDNLLEIVYRIEQWPFQRVLKSSVVAKIIRFERVRANAYISLDVSSMVTLWNHGIPSRPRSCSLFFISICLKVGLINAWESFILGVECVFIKGLSLTNSWLSAYQSLIK